MKMSRVWAMVSLALLAVAGMTLAGETLYNGIELPDKWPPAYKRSPREPMPVPYLDNPPAVIPIDVGRQLFVDDFLIEKTTLKREFHQPEYHEANPVLKPDREWETTGKSNVAYPYSGGAWYDPADKLFKLWYSVGNRGYVTDWFGYATSKDGVHWDKPAVKDIPNRPKKLDDSNVVLVTPHHDSSTFWLDLSAKDRTARFKYFTTERGGGRVLCYRTSGDGIHWTEPIASRGGGYFGDRTTVFYNPFRKVWVISVRVGWAGRARAYTEDPDPAKAVTGIGRRVMWCAGEELDPRNPAPKYQGIAPQLYNLDATPYENLMLGLFAVWTGPSNADVARLGIQKRSDILVGFSRDGFHWHRPFRQRFIACTWKQGDWNFGNVQSAAGGCLIVRDKLYFYVSARTKDPTGGHGNGSTGLAILRRDGFASMQVGDKGGTLTTRPLTFKGKRLFVNVDCPKGKLKAEVLDRDGKVIEPFTIEKCKAVSCDKTLVAVTWTGADDLSALSGKPVRLRFHLENGSLYAFWVSPDASGASHGYVAAGGPGFTGPTDTVGIGAYK